MILSMEQLGWPKLVVVPTWPAWNQSRFDATDIITVRVYIMQLEYTPGLGYQDHG